MKKLNLFLIVAAFVSCGESKKENEVSAEIPVKIIRCDSIETVYIDSITGKQTFYTYYRCDSTRNVHCDSIDEIGADAEGNEFVTKVWKCDSTTEAK